MEQIKVGKKKAIYPIRGISYVSPKKRNGWRDQFFSTDDLPKKLTAVMIGKENIEGEWYEKYTLQNPIFIFETFGALGWVNFQKELENIMQIFEAKTRLGKKIEKVRSIAVEDINLLTNVTVDDERGLLFSNKRSITNTNCSELGKTIKISKAYSPQSYVQKEKSLEKRLEVVSTAYSYQTSFLELSRQVKKLISSTKPYFLNTTSKIVYTDYAGYCIGRVYEDYVSTDYSLFYSGGEEYGAGLAIRPVFYIKVK